jgi:hypothetical protein
MQTPVLYLYNHSNLLRGRRLSSLCQYFVTSHIALRRFSWPAKEVGDAISSE